MSATKVLGELAGIAEGRTADVEPVLIKNERGKTVGKVSASSTGALVIKLQPMRDITRRVRKQRLDEARARALALLDADDARREATQRDTVTASQAGDNGTAAEPSQPPA